MSKTRRDGGHSSEEEADRSDFLVIGAELARAATAEELRKARGNLERSPMPDQKYDYWGGETSLVRPVPLPLDSKIAEVCEQFAAADQPARDGLRFAISMDEFYTLIEFARRAAVFAVRGRDPDWVASGMTALAMIDPERVDYRDIVLALSLLHHAAERAGMNSAKIFEETASRSEPQVAELLVGFVKSPKEYKDVRHSWGYEEVVTDVGVGFIGWDSQKYKPAYDLKAVAIEIADFVATDKYLPDSVEVATDFSRVWLGARDRAVAERAMKSIRACASVSGKLRPEQSPDHDSQHFIVFLVELASESDCQRLLEIANQTTPSDYFRVPLAEGKLFCVIVARSFVEGIDAFETQQSLTRFIRPITDIIHRHVAKQTAVVSSQRQSHWAVSTLRRLGSAIRGLRR